MDAFTQYLIVCLFGVLVVVVVVGLWRGELDPTPVVLAIVPLIGTLAGAAALRKKDDSK